MIVSVTVLSLYNFARNIGVIYSGLKVFISRVIIAVRSNINHIRNLYNGSIKTGK